MDANEKESNSKQNFLWDFFLWKLMNANTFLLGFSILNESNKTFLFFFVALSRMNSKNTKQMQKQNLKQRNSFYGFSVYDEKQMQTNMNDARIE